ncbi:MAG: 4Fe-4S binding protein [Desulfarculaceae bacterium]|nr:4Fe-4S binding protein [Desulfarculaceae bacterium]MCF8099716.1 4Fe-4S binding protein [Desulfarculaceae bacterium]MCF8121705.1 4Fe-4S binding protein [Desulfarculaceae bacterium]
MTSPAQDAHEALAQHMDRSPLGAPQGPELMAILRELFTPEEAAVASALPFKPVRAAALAQKLERPADQIAALLESLAAKGLAYRRGTKAGDYYSLLPMVPGMAEAQFWAMAPGEAKLKMARLFEDYYEPGVGKAFAESPTPYSRVIPVGRSIENSQEILPYEKAEELIRQHEHLALIDCYCRSQAKLLGQGCDAPLDVCMIFGSFAEFAIGQGWAQPMDEAGMMDALARAEEAGLVHVVDNVAENVNFLCNCCGCCCMFLQTITRMNHLGAVSQAAYFASVDPELCTACGECADTCQVAAVRVDDDCADFDQEICLGCGQCATVCPSEAIKMTRREARPVPAHHGELQAGLADARGVK